MALNPAGSHLYVKQSSRDPIRLLRVPAAGGQAEEIPIPGDFRLSQNVLAPTAVDKRGRILLEVASPNSYYFGTVLLDPSRNIAHHIPLNFDGDVWGPGWTAGGRIAAFGAQINASLWRYRRTSIASADPTSPKQAFH